MNPPLVSVCIPTANLGAKSLIYLDRCLASVRNQQYPPVSLEVVISDHSVDDEIELEIPRLMALYGLDIRYYRNVENIGFTPANLNNAIAHANGTVIKPMLQDDRFCNCYALNVIVNVLMGDHHWCAVGCKHMDDDQVDCHPYLHPPRWDGSTQMALGNNLIGSPSVVAFLKTDERFQGDLRFLWDCEMYYRLGKAHGAPGLIDETMVTITIRETSFTKTLSATAKAVERQQVERSL